MATKYINKNTGTWHLNYTDPRTGKRLRPAIGTEAQADKALIEFKYKLQSGYFTGFFEIKAISYFQNYKDYLDRLYRPKTAKRYRSIIQNLIEWMESNYPRIKLHEVSPLVINQYKEKRINADKSNATINTELYAFSGGFEYAIEKELIKENPVRKVKKLEKQKNPVLFWEPDECREIVRYFYGKGDCDGEFLGDIFTVFFNTGIRRDELRFLLKRQDFIIQDKDTQKGIINIRTKHLPGGEIWYPKWKIQRRVPVNPLTFRVFEKYLNKKNNSRFLFRYIHDAPEVIPKNYLRNRLISALKDMDMFQPGYTLHTTRHSFATMIANQPGVDLRAVQDILGHQSIETTMIYLHTSDQRKDYAINQVFVGG